MSEYKIIKNCDIYTPLELIKNGFILIKGEKITKVGKINEINELKIPEEIEIFDFKNHLAVPGFIDIHLHGGGGADFMDSSSESIVKALKTHLKNGTTSLLPTVMAASHQQIIKTIKALIQVKKEFKEIPDILGLNLEGPYISKEKSGVQLKKFIRKPSLNEMKEYIETSEENIKIMTIAPEIEGAMNFIYWLINQKIIPSAGHTNANFLQTEQAIKAGIKHATHLFNAMRGIFHREPGAAGALLFNDEVSVEVIADGVHLHPSILSLITKVKPIEKIILITDATKFTGLKQGAVFTQEGKLSGSTLTLDSAFKNMIKFTGKSFKEILMTLTLNPAKILNIEDKKGYLKKGSDADIVILDKELNVRKVFLKGKILTAECLS
jgi:N-acetylglucosamine-6-phosphate deacetylase